MSTAFFGVGINVDVAFTLRAAVDGLFDDDGFSRRWWRGKAFDGQECDVVGVILWDSYGDFAAICALCRGFSYQVVAVLYDGLCVLDGALRSR